jgi:hypothetical protein
MLEAEFMTRANTAQLEKWNGELMRLSVPAAGQLMAGETALARLEQPGAATDRQFAGYIVPEAVPDLNLPSPAGSDNAVQRAPRPAAQTVAAIAPVKPQPIAPADTVKVKSVVISAEADGKREARRSRAVEQQLLRDTSFNDLLRGSDVGGSTLR